jgi:gliding motility-associated-like protein
MQKINKILLICLFILAGLQSNFATHIVGGTLEYVRLGPGALPNSTRYKIVLRLWRDGVGASSGVGLPSSVTIECRGDTLGYTNAGFDPLTKAEETGLYPYKGLDRMRQVGTAITEANIINLSKPQFVRDFNISNVSYLDTLTVSSGYLTSANPTLFLGGGGTSNGTFLAPTTGVPSYENPLYVRSGYPAAQFNKREGGFIRGMVTVSGKVGYGDYKNSSGVIDYSKICGEGRLCVSRYVDSCTSAPAVYIQYADYMRVVDLPNIPGGYHLNFSLCCRNNAIKNINNAGNTGYSVYARIPDIATLDNSVSYIASSVPGFWTGNAQNITVGGVSTPHINNLGSSVSNVTIMGLASSFSGNVYTPSSPNTLVSANSLIGASNFTVVGVPASFKTLYNDLGINISTGLGFNNSVSGYSVTSSTSAIVAMVRNSSPKYKTTPPLFVCSYNATAEQILGHSQNPAYDHGAFDMDGDSIVYSFATPTDALDKNIAEYKPFIGIWKTSTSTINGIVFRNGDPLVATVPFAPYPENTNLETVNLATFRSGFSTDKPLGMNVALGEPSLVLNPNTGDLKIQPAGNLNGLYVVSIKAQEFRKMPDGSSRFLGEITRDYQFNVLSCPLPAQALSTTTGLNGTAGCNATSVSLKNSSTEAATSFYWDSGKDRYVLTSVGTAISVNTATGVTTTATIPGLKRIWASNGSINNDAQDISTNVFKQTRATDPITGVLSAPLNATFNYTTPGTYFFKLVVQDRGSKCSDSVYQAVVVSSVKAGWTQLNPGPVCVNAPVTYSPFDVSSVGGITSVSGSSIYTDINTNPIPKIPFVKISGTQTITGFKNYKWMKQHGSLATDTIPPSHAVPQPAKLVAIQWDFGDGTIQVLTLVGSTWEPLGGSFNSNVSVTGLVGPLSIPGIIKSYTSPGIYNVTQTVFNQFGCSNSLTRSITVIKAQPTASIIGSNICQNNPITTISGQITVASGGVWSTSASGIFLQTTTMSGNSFSINYKPSPAELTLVGFVLPISLTTYGNGVCNAGTSALTPGVTVLSSPIVYAGGTVTICRNNLSAYQLVGTVTGGSSTGIWKTMGTGTFVSTNSTTTSSLTDTYKFSKVDSTKGFVKLALTSTNNGSCFAVTDTLTLKVGSSASVPTAEAGLPVVVCANNSIVNLSGTITNASSGVWTTKGSGTFGAGAFPSSTTLTGTNAFYTPSGPDTLAGSVKLFLQTTLPTVNGGCKNASDSLILTIVSSPSLAISIKSPITSGSNKDFTACSNNAVFTITGTITGATGGIWNVGSGSYLPSTSPSVVSIGTNKYTSSLKYLPSSAEIAQANSVGFYRPLVKFTSTGNGTCNAVTTNSLIQLLAAPSVTILGGASSISVCKNNTNVALTSLGNPTIGFGGYGVQWSTIGTGTYTGSTLQNTIYRSSNQDTTNGSIQLILAGTNNSLNCLPTYDTLKVVYTNIPTLSAGSNQTICENNLLVQLNGSVTTPASGGIWTTTGTGSFASTGTTKSSTLNDIYIPNISDFSSGNLVLGLATSGPNIGTGLGQCLSTSKAIVVGITAKPSVTFGNIPVVNENNPMLSVSATSAGVNILASSVATWGNGLGTYSPNKTNFTYVAAAPAPFNSPALVSAITYLPSITELAAKQVKLTVSVSGANNCNPVSNLITIPISPKPTATIFNKGITVCANNPIIKLTSTVTGATGGIWYSKVNANPVNFTAPGFNAIYIPLTSEINAGSVKLYFSTTGELNNAKSELDSIIIPITPAPIVNTGGNIVMCGTNASTSITGTISNALGGIWSTSGTGTFTNLNSIAGSTMNNFYSPSALDKSSASPVKLTLTSIDNKGCVAVSDIMNLSFSVSPVANAGQSQVVCVNDFPVKLNASGTSGSWSSTRIGGIFGSTNQATSTTLVDTYLPTTIPGVIVMTWTTIGNASCPSVLSNTTITVLSAPTVNIGENVTICGTNNKVTLAATVTGALSGNWQASGSGSFSSFGSQIGLGLNDTYNLTASDIASGQITITFSGTGTSPCTPTKATKTITIIPVVTAFAGPDQNLCTNISSFSATGVLFANGVVTTLLGGKWTASTGTGVLFSGASNSLTSKFIPSFADKNTSPQKVGLVFTPNSLSGCTFNPDTVVYSFINAPTVSIFGTDFTVCSDANAISLNGTFSGAAGMIYSTSGTNLNSSWSLSNTNTSTTYQPTNADMNVGKLSFRAATNGTGLCGTIYSNIINVTIAGKPIVSAGNDLSICSNLSSFSLTGANITTTGIVSPTVVWFSSASTATGGSFDNVTTIGINNLGDNPIYTPSTADIAGGAITLFVSVTGPGTCKSQLAQRLITFTPAPTVNVNAPVQTYCANTPTITLTGSTTISNNGFWTITTLGVTGTLTPFAASKLATYKPSLADMNLTSVGFLFATTQTGCNPVTTSKTILLSPAPIVKIVQGNALTVCGDVLSVGLQGISSVTGAGNWSVVNSSGGFSPNSATLTVNFAPLVAEIKTAYTNRTPIKVYFTSNNNGVCAANKDSTQIFFTSPPVISAGSDESFCASTSVLSLTGVQISSDITSVKWTTSANATITGGMGTFLGTSLNTSTLVGESYLPASIEKLAGSTRLTLVSTGNSAGCQPVSAQKTITFEQLPTLNDLPDQTICVNNVIKGVKITANATNFSSILWSTSNGRGNFDFDNITSPTYYPANEDITVPNTVVTITCQVMGLSLCSPVIKQFRINISPAPTLDYTVPSVVCADAGLVQLNSLTTSGFGISWTNVSGMNTLSGGGFFPNRFDLNPKYQLSTDDISKGFVIFNISTTGNGGCNAAVTTVQMSITPLPTITTSSDLNLCDTKQFLDLTFAGTGFTTGLWTSNGDKTSNGAPTLPSPTATIGSSTQYNFSSDDIHLRKQITLMVTSQDQGLCQPVSAKFTVSFTGSPVISAGLGANYCEDIGVFTLPGTIKGAETYDYLWVKTQGQGNGFLTNSIVGSSIGNGVTSTTSILNTYNIGSEIESVRHDPAFAFKVYVSVTGVCAKFDEFGNISPYISSQVDINIVTKPVITITSSVASFCQDASSIQMLASLSNTSDITGITTGVIWSGKQIGGAGKLLSASQFSSSVFDNEVKFYPSTTDRTVAGINFTVSTTGNNLCGTQVESYVVSVTSTPKVTVSGTGYVCSNQPLITLVGISSTNQGVWTSGTFAANAGTFVGVSTTGGVNTAIYNVSQTEIENGSATFNFASADNGTCSATTKSFSSKINLAPVVDAGGTLSVCASAPINLSGTVSVQPLLTAPGSIYWNISAGTGTVTNTTITTVSVAGTVIENATSTFNAAGGTGAKLFLNASLLGCNLVKDSLQLTYQSVSTLLGDNVSQSFCSSDLFQLKLNPSSSQGIWSTTGSGFFLSTGNQTTTKMNDVYKPSTADVGKEVYFVLSSISGLAACGSPSPFTFPTTFTGGIASDAGTSVQIAVCKGFTPTFVGTTTGSHTFRWYTSGTGNFSLSGINTVNGVSIATNKFTATDIYFPSDVDKASGKVVLSMVAYPDASSNCVSTVKDTLTVVFTDKPKAISKGYSRLCGNVSLADGITVTGVVRLSTPNDVNIYTVHDNASRWKLMNTTSLGFANSKGNKTGFVNTSSGPNTDLFKNGGGYATYSSTSITGFQEIEVNTIYYPTDYDIVRQFSGDTLSLVIESSEVAFSGGVAIQTITGTTYCDPALDTLKIIFDKSPTASILGASLLNICADKDTINLKGAVTLALGGLWNTSNGLGSFQPDATSSSVIYKLSTEEQSTTTLTSININYQSTGNGSCYPAQSNFVLTVNINPKPKIYQGTDQTICADNPTVTLIGYSLTTTSAIPTSYQWVSLGNGSITPLSSSGFTTVGVNNLSATYALNATDVAFGNVNFVLSTTGPNTCADIKQTMKVNINPLPVLTPAPGITICKDIDNIPLFVTAQNISAFNWSVSVVSGLTTTTGLGTFTGNGLTSVSTMVGSDLTNVVYSLTTSDKLADRLVFNIVSAGTLPSTSSPPCNATYGSISVNLTPIPTVSLASLAPICSDEVSFALNGSITGALGGLWASSGSGLFSPVNPLTSTDLSGGNNYYTLSSADRNLTGMVITLTATDIGTCTKNYAATAPITINKLPSVNTGGDTTVCSDAPSIYFSNSSVSDATSVSWISLGTGTFSGQVLTTSGTWVYKRTAADSAAGLVVFQLNAVGSGLCKSITGFKTVFFDKTPKITISAGLNQILCSDNQLINLNGYTDGQKWSWSAYKNTIAGLGQQFFPSGSASAGRGIFRSVPDSKVSQDSTAINPTYFPSMEDTLGTNRNFANQVLDIRFRAFGNGSCSNQAYASYMKVTFTPRPVLAMASIPAICENDSRPVTLVGYFLNTIAGAGLWQTSGAGEFLPSNAVVYSPSVSGVYYPTSTDKSVNRQVSFSLQAQKMGTCANPITTPVQLLTINSAPGINPGSDRAVCETTPTISLTGLLTGVSKAQWRSSGTGVFSSNLTNAGANLTFSGNVLRDVYRPSASDVLAGKVNIFLKSTATTLNCPLDSVKFSLTLDKTPVVTVGLDKTICVNEGVISLSGTVTNVPNASWSAVSPASGSFRPSAAGLSTQYLLSTADQALKKVQFVLTSGSNQCKPATSSPVTYFINQLPTANAGNPSVCTINGIKLTGKSTNAITAYWQTDGTGVFSPSAFDSDATYYPSENDVLIKKIVKLSFIADGGAFVCSNSTSSVSLNVGDNPIPSANAGRDDLICKSGVYRLSAINPSGANSYIWNISSVTGSGPALVTISSALSVDVKLNTTSLYVLKVTNNSNQCVNTDSIKVQVLTLPSLDLTPRVCYNDTLVLPYNQATPISNSDGTYQWYKDGVIVAGQTSPKRIKATTRGDYTLEYTEFSCSTKDTTNVRPIPSLFTRGKVICAGSSTTLTPLVLTIQGINTNNYTYDWALNYNSSVNGFNYSRPVDTVNAKYRVKTISVMVTQDSAKYLVAVIDTTFKLNCTTYDTVRVKTHPTPKMQLKDVVGCGDDVVSLNAQPLNLQTPKIFTYLPSIVKDTVNATYSWVTNPSGLVLSPTSAKISVTKTKFGAGDYTATFSIGECSATATAKVSFDAAPKVSNLATVPYCVEDQTGITLDAGSGTDLSYLWLSSGNISRTEVVYDTTTYYFKVFNKAGCSVLDSILVKSSCTPKVYIPGAFIPDETCLTDNCNNKFLIRGRYFKNFKIRIYNRWGEVIFASESKDFAWDGTYNGTALPFGIYPYLIEYESIYDDQPGIKVERGNVTLVR